MKVKRITALVLIFLLTFGNIAFGAVLPIREVDNTKRQANKSLTEIKTEELAGQYNADDKVRVIVELDGEVAIQYAQKKGVKYDELSETEKGNLQSAALEAQEETKAQISSQKIEIDYITNFTTVVNGFSAEVEYGSLPLLEALPNVGKVHIVNEYQRPTVKPEMVYSKELVQAQEAWREYGYKGEGMVVGVIDTGIDPSHRDMVLSEETEPKLTEELVNSQITANELPGMYYTEKVPYGYNYMDNNQQILDIGPDASMHGMHVSGTVAANGDEANDGIKGVAPEAQLLALKVFGNDPEMPSTFGDIYVKAIDDAIALGVDVINMSLGSTAAFVIPEDPEQEAVKRAVESGVLMAISAGNSAHFGNGFDNPFASNPDIGVSGSPGVSYESLQVASFENQFMDLDAVTYTIGENAAAKAPFMSSGNVHPTSLGDESYELVYAGLGRMPGDSQTAPDANDFEGLNVEGKFVLIQRGESPFVSKTLNAQAAGAAGVIIFNNLDGFINMANDPEITIPHLFMLKENGSVLKTALEADETVTVSFEGDLTKSPNPAADKMSAFTSWGLTPNLDFKPEITAPGGQIYSTLNDDTYGMMSGTSMAAPHVAGGSALVLQRVDEQFDLAGSNRVNMAKNILMNTASPVIDKGTINTMFGFTNPYSPRRQGAGIMQLHSALSTPVVVTDVVTNEAKVALKEVGDNLSFTLNAQNFSDTAVTYNVGVNVQTDLSLFGVLGYAVDELEAQALDGAIVTVNNGNNVVEVPANGSVTITVEVDLTNAVVLNRNASGYVPAVEVFPNGYFAEGYVTLTETTDTHPELTVPYVGFKGDWDKAPVLDGTKYDDESSFYGMTGLVYASTGGYSYLGYSPSDDSFKSNAIAISPNGDGIQDQAIPILSFLRNAKKVEFNVVAKDGETILRTLRTENNVRKNYYDGGRAAQYSLNPVRGWDGKVKNALATEGLYYYQIKTVIDFPGAEAQTVNIPVFVDNQVPTLEATLDSETLEFTLASADNENGSGINYVAVVVNGEVVDFLSGDVTTYSFTNQPAEGSLVQLVAVDNAGNEVALEFPNFGDDTIPFIFADQPTPFGTFNTLEIPVSGYVTDSSGIETVQIAGKDVGVIWNEETGKNEFSTTLTFENDGVHKFKIGGTDIVGNDISFERTIFIDSEAPTLTINGLPSKKTLAADAENPKVSVTIEDNFDEIRFSLDGSELFYNEYVEPYVLRGFEQTFEDIELVLEDGENTFVFEVTDLAGNKTTKEVTLTKGEATSPGNGGGNNGGGYTPPVVIPVPQDPTTKPADQGNVVVDDKNGKATLKVDETKIDSQITDSSTDEVVIELGEATKGSDMSEVNAEFNATTLDKIATNKKSLVVNTGTSSVKFSTKVIEDIAKQADGNVSLSVIADKAGADLPVALPGQKVASNVFDFTVSVNDGEFTISKFAEPVEVTLSVDSVTDSRKAAAYYLNEETNKWEYVGGKVANGELVFKANHFSKYAVLENNRTFTDVTKHWAKDEIEVLASRAVIQGKTDTTFKPGDKLTRAEFAVLLVRSFNLELTGYEGTFKDVSAYQAWSARQIEAAYRAGIVKGDLQGNYNPSQNITREEMAVMIVRAIEHQNKQLLDGKGKTLAFNDNAKIGNFAKEAVSVASDLGIINGKADGSFTPKEATNRAEASVMLYRLLEKLGEL